MNGQWKHHGRREWGEHTDLRLAKDKDAGAHKKEGGGPIVHTSNGWWTKPWSQASAPVTQVMCCAVPSSFVYKCINEQYIFYNYRRGINDRNYYVVYHQELLLLSRETAVRPPHCSFWCIIIFALIKRIMLSKHNNMVSTEEWAGGSH